jgi:hypothetical protein
MSYKEPDYPDHLDAAQRAELEAVRKRIPQYFQKRIKEDPAVIENGAVRSLWATFDNGVSDGERAKHLCKEVFKTNIRRVEDTLLKAKLYTAGHYHPGIAFAGLFATYEDRTFLWLDDHIDNHDFDTFLQREQIKWQDTNLAANFVLKHKFWYLYLDRARVVSSIEEIPRDKFRADALAAGDTEFVEDYDRRLSEVTPYLKPPTLNRENEELVLRFCTWVYVGGLVHSIECRLNAHDAFSFAGTLRESFVGDFFMPR